MPAAVQLEHTYIEINKAIAALMGDTGGTYGASAITSLAGTETIPVWDGTPRFITYTNLLTQVSSDIDATYLTEAEASAAYQPLDSDLTAIAGATWTSAGLASVITDETGSGNVVFSTSPTLVTPALGTPSALVLTNATGLPAASVLAGSLGTGNFTVTGDLAVTGTVDGVDIAALSSAYTTHAASDGSDHTFIDQSVVSGASPTFTGTNITGVPAASILAGTFGTGAYVISTGASGASPHADSDDFTVHGSGNTGISVMSPDANNSRIALGSPTDPIGGQLVWNYDALLFRVGTERTGASVRVISGNGAAAVEFDANQDADFQGNDISNVGTLTATTLAGTLSTATQNSVTTMTGLTTVGTIGTGTWQGTAIDSAYIDQTLSVSTLDTTGDITQTQSKNGIFRFHSTANDSSWVIGTDVLGAVEFYSDDGSGVGAGVKAAIRAEVQSAVSGGRADLVFTAGSSVANDVEMLRLDALDEIATFGTIAVSGITTLTATTLNGTLGTAAQPNVTSVGTLTGLTVGGLLNVSVAGGATLRLSDSLNSVEITSVERAGGSDIAFAASNQAVYLTLQHTTGNVVHTGTNVQIASDLTLASGSITSASGAIDFGNELITFGNTLTTNNVIRTSTGSVGAPAYSFSADTDIGMYRVGANWLGFATGGSLRYGIDSSGNHDFQSGTITTTGAISGGAGTFTGNTRVGAGGGGYTAHTSYDTLVIDEGVTNTGITIFSGPAAYGAIQFGDATATNTQGTVGYSHSGDNLYFRAANTGVGNWSSTGLLVGDETTSPDGTLHVHTASAGAVAASTTYDDLVVENSVSAGISVLSPDASAAGIYLGSVSSAAGAVIDWGYDALTMKVGPLIWGSSLVLQAHTAVTNLTLSGASGSELAVAAGNIHANGTGSYNYLAGDLRIGTTSATSHGQEVLRAYDNSTGGRVFNVHNQSAGQASYAQWTTNTSGTASTDGMLVGLSGSDNALVWNYESTPTLFATANTERLRIASDAYAIGIGTTDVESWSSSYGAIEFGGGAAIMAANSGTNGEMYLLSNAYYDGSWKYKATNEAVRQGFYDGFLNWSTAASGTVDTAITWSEKMRLTNGGFLGLGGGASVGRLLHLHATSNTDVHLTNDTTGALSTDGGTITMSGLDFLVNNREAGDVVFYTSGSAKARFSGDSLFIGDTANANMTVGLTINQGANDDEAFALKSSDVAHGVTAVAETDTFANFLKTSATDGGLTINGLADLNNTGIILQGIAVTDNTTKTAAGAAYTEIRGYKKSGTGVVAPGANANILAVRSSSSTVFIVDADGDYHYDGADGGAFDTYQDAQMVRAFATATSKNTLRTAHDDWVQYNEQDLVDIGVLGAPVAEGGLINGAQLQRLHTGAIWQNYTAIADTTSRVDQLESELAEQKALVNTLQKQLGQA